MPIEAMPVSFRTNYINLLLGCEGDGICALSLSYVSGRLSVIMLARTQETPKISHI
jgi:hypothetical protein